MLKRYVSILTWLLVLLPLPQAAVALPSRLEKATFAGGCFWCMEAPFEALDGVVEVVSGFSGGEEENPTYEQVASGHTRHLEAVQITYDPAKVDYATLLEIYWRQIDPTDDGGQFVDRGHHYRSAIFYHTDAQRQQAEASRNRLNASGRYSQPIVTAIRRYDAFYPAEDDHQDFHKRSARRYTTYRHYSGRDQYLDQVWGTERQMTQTTDNNTQMNTWEQRRQTFHQPDDATLKQQLTPLQYQVTQHEDTERPFDNPYNDEKRAGLYVDIVSGEPLFSSRHKFDSGTGWPSFYRPVTEDALVEKKDRKLFIVRTEVRSRLADSHLGHVFEDGPPPTGLRYCINSAALRFIPLETMAEEGYAAWIDRVEPDAAP
ncbi:peptide-methionine (R)-S-oxide reductase MsrB [uncultured Desulfuromonas sp.]|uniref:peptide-methionine (R)-S-oxide reductase MsrB n=1 Tax=uncultured Desulfuromonas sp. TaxID=181013 RepID=UPI002AAC0741|nr:peptide-methionine (R)-S-oxide reductase MsrB [uncultured Desulfuromonas sp.]